MARRADDKEQGTALPGDPEVGRDLDMMVSAREYPRQIPMRSRISACPSRKDYLMTSDLYHLPAGGAEFTRFCGGNLQGEQESCVELAEIPGSGSAFILRDSKAAGKGRELRFTARELDDFARGYAARRGLSL